MGEEDVYGLVIRARDLRNHLMSSAEFREKNPDAAVTATRTVVIKELDGPGSPRLFIDLADHVMETPPE